MKKKSRLLLLLCMMIMVLAVPVQTQAATKFKASVTGATKPTTLKKGAFFSIKGTVKANKTIKKALVSIYNSSGKTKLQGYTTNPNSKTFNIAKADAHLLFNKLNVGTYKYLVTVYDAAGKKVRVINKSFTVKGTGTIKIVNPLPSKNISIKAGSSYAIGGKITSTYNLASVTAKIINSKNKAVYSKTVKPKKKTYTVNNSALDSAMLFNKLAVGTYKYQLTAVDSQGTSATLVLRTITVTSAGTTNTTPGSTGSNPYNGNGTYLNATGTVVRPSGFAARTGRPAANNAYYYNGNYNIYYKYNSLAPTGKAYYGSTYVMGNCTWYACGRAMEIVAKAGKSVSNVQAIFGGDPVQIYNMNVSKKKFSYGSTPKIGALAIFNYGSNGDAHIAVVEDIINGIPYVSESGYSVSSTTKPNAAKSNIIFKYQSIYAWAGGRSLRGYIYLI